MVPTVPSFIILHPMRLTRSLETQACFYWIREASTMVNNVYSKSDVSFTQLTDFVLRRRYN
jgi:hypothetical protein